MDINGGAPPSSESSIGTSRAGAGRRNRGTYQKAVKPALDRTLGAFFLLLALPVILIAGIAILISLGRPVFYSQERIGLNGKIFRLHKLRTMMPDRRVEQNGYSAERRRTHKSVDDPRVTAVGKVLRSARLDELPQLWNVVKGDMSLVGPRPEMPEIVSKYQPWQHERHVVKPGVTGPWQISIHNGKPMHECTEIDLEYINKMSLLDDLRILVRTPLAMVGGRKGH